MPNNSNSNTHRPQRQYRCPRWVRAGAILGWFAAVALVIQWTTKVVGRLSGPSISASTMTIIVLAVIIAVLLLLLLGKGGERRQ